MPSLVIGQQYSTAGVNGRKTVYLDNGWIVICVHQSTTRIQFYVSKDGGQNFQLLCYTIASTYPAGFALVSKGTRVIAVTMSQGTAIRYINFDAATVNMGSFVGTTGSIDSGLTNNLSCSLAIYGNDLHAIWDSKIDTYPNSFNIRYAKGTINANGTVTWNAVQQLTTLNATNANYYNPTITTVNGRPIFMYEYNQSGAYGIGGRWYNGTNWITITSTGNTYSGIYSGGSFMQHKPCAVVDKKGVIHLVWYGADGSNARHRIRYSKSLDGGINWTPAIVITPNILSTSSGAATSATISVDHNDKLYVYMNYMPTTNQQVGFTTSSNSGDTWSPVVELTNEVADVQANPTVMEKEKGSIIGFAYMRSQGVMFDYVSLNASPTLNLAPSPDNLLGTDGNCEDPTKFAIGFGASPTTFTTSTDRVYGDYSIMYGTAGTSSARMRPISLIAGRYYLLACVAKSSDGIAQITAAVRKPDGTYIKTTKAAPKNFTFDYKAFVADGTENNVGFFYAPSGGTGIGYIDGIRLYEISKAVYDKIDVDPEYTGNKLAQKFPYTDPTTLDNLLGTDGDFKTDSNGDGVADGWARATNGTYSVVNGRQRVESATGDTVITSRNVYKQMSVTSGKKYLFLVDLYTDGVSQGYISFGSGNASAAYSVNRTLYLRYAPGTTGLVNAAMYNYRPLGEVGWVEFDKARIYEIDQATYDKIGTDPEYTGEKLAKRFPYADPVTYPTLSDGDTLQIAGTVLDANDLDTVTVEFKIDTLQYRTLLTYMSDGNTPVEFSKLLLYRNRRLWDDGVDIIGYDMDTSIAHAVTVRAVDSKGAKSAEITRSLNVNPNSPLTLTVQIPELGVTVANGESFSFREPRTLPPLLITTDDADPMDSITVECRLNIHGAHISTFNDVKKGVPFEWIATSDGVNPRLFTSGATKVIITATSDSGQTATIEFYVRITQPSSLNLRMLYSTMLDLGYPVTSYKDLNSLKPSQDYSGPLSISNIVDVLE